MGVFSLRRGPRREFVCEERGKGMGGGGGVGEGGLLKHGVRA